MEIKKVSAFLNKFPHINWNEYFGAPRQLNPDEDCPNLNFFTTRAAIKCYNLFKTKQEARNPDNQLEEIKSGMHFIGMFCFKHKIFLDQYLQHKDGLMYSWVKHYKEHNINPYCLMELGDIMSLISDMQNDEREIYVKDLSENMGKFKIRYFSSIKTKELVKASTERIQVFLKKNLQSK
jgi:hypothetical protein